MRRLLLFCCLAGGMLAGMIGLSPAPAAMADSQWPLKGKA